MKIEWEDIEDNHSGYLRRTKVPGGWLVKITEDVFSPADREYNSEQGYEWRSSLTFVPDPNNEWN